MTNTTNTHINNLIQTHLDTTGTPRRVLAATILEHLRTTDPDILNDWLQQHAEDLITAHIARLDSASRAQARIVASKSVFRTAATQHEQGNPASLQSFLDGVWTGVGGVRRTLAEMTHLDLTAAASVYERRALSSAVIGTFLRKLSQRCELAGKPVGELYTEEELARMWLSVNPTPIKPEPKPAEIPARRRRAA